jgi:hypothetical protein
VNCLADGLGNGAADRAGYRLTYLLSEGVEGVAQAGEVAAERATGAAERGRETGHGQSPEFRRLTATGEELVPVVEKRGSFRQQIET